MQIILLEKVVNLGQLGDVVKVKDGYARNFLIPHGKAKRANTANLAEFEKRRAELEKSGGFKIPPSQTPWQEMYRNTTEQLAQGMIIKGSTKFQRVAKTMGIPRDNH